MKLFGGTTPQERAISCLIHDHINATCLLGTTQLILKKALEQNDMETIKKYIERLDYATKKVKSVLDAYVEKAKNDFQ